jgi:iron-sulfur cluster assembly accessory protein
MLRRAASAAFSSQAAAGAPLVLTARALARLGALRARAAAEGRADARALALRVRVDSGGCSGLRYDFSLDGGGAQAGDVAVGGDGGAGAAAAALVDEASLELVRGATVDWDDSLARSAFVVLANPNADAACGCKMSFSPAAPKG